MSPFLIIVLILINALPVLADRSRVQGQVRDAGSAQELENVLVEMPGRGRRVYTNAAGEFIFDDLAPGSLSLHLSHIAYQPLDITIALSEVGEEHLQLELQPRSIISPELVVRAERDAVVEVEGAGNLLVLRGNDVEHSAGDPGALLAQLPGVSLDRDGGAAGTTVLRIDGSLPSQVLVMVDGVALNPGCDHAVDLSQLDFSQLEVIEYRRGSNATTSAIAGSINLVSRREVQDRSNLRTDVSWPRAWRTRFGLTRAIGSTRFRMDLNRSSSHGRYPYQDPLSNTERERRNNDRSAKGIAFGLSSATSRIPHVLRFSWQESDKGIGDRLDLADQYLLRESQREWRLNLDFWQPQQKGFRLVSWHRRQDQEGALSGGRREELQVGEGQGAWPLQVSQLESAQLLLNVRHQDYVAQTRFDDQHSTRSEIKPSAEFRRHDSVHGNRQRLALSGLIRNDSQGHNLDWLGTLDLDQRLFTNRSTLLRLTLGRTVRIPSFLESFPVGGTQVLGNPALLPERFHELRLLCRRTFNQADSLTGGWHGWLEAEVLERRAENLILWRQTNANAWKAFNLGRARIRQFRLGARMHFGHLWHSRAEFTMLDPRNREPGVNQGNYLPHRALNTWQFALRRTWNRSYLEVLLRGEGRRYHNESNQSGLDLADLQAWAVLDLHYGSKKSWTHLRLDWGVFLGNLLDESYRLVPRVPLPGRSLRLYAQLELI